MLNRCGLTHARVNLQEFKNLYDSARFLYASNFGPDYNRHPTYANVAITQSCCLSNENACQINKNAVKPIFRQNNAPRLPYRTVSETAAVLSNENKLKRVSMSDSVLKDCRRNVNKSIHRDLDELNNEY